MTTTRDGQTRRSVASTLRRFAGGVAVAMVIVACGDDGPVFSGPEDLDGLEPAEICALLAEAERPEAMAEEAYDELIAGFAELCAQLGVPLPPSGAPSNGAFDAGGAGPGGPADGRDRGADSSDQRGNGARTDGDLAGQDPFDDDVRRRAIAAGLQCDPSAVDLSLSEVMKAPAIGPMGSPPFDAALANAQYRALATCLPEPYRTEWLVIAAAYEPLFDLLEAYAAASNAGFEALVELGAIIADLEPQFAALQSDEVQSAMASTEAFFAELRESGAWDHYEAASPWGRWWEGEQFRRLWSDAQWAGLQSGAQLPDLPTIP